MTGLAIVLAADESAGARTLSLLERSPHTVVAIAESRPGDSGGLADRAERLGVPFLDARRLGRPETADEVRATHPDVLLNVHSLTKVCTEVLDVFEVGAWNLHPGPLPEAAGINVPSWAIALGWEEHGVTVHRMTAEYDEGHIAYEDRFPIRERSTGLTLSAECGSRGVRLISQLIDQLAEDPAAVPALRQDHSRRNYYGRGQPADGVIDWAQPAASIDAHVRAADFRPFPSPWNAPRALVDGEWHELIEVAVGRDADAAPGITKPIDGTDGAAIEVAAGDRWIQLTETRKVEAQ